MSTRSEIIDRAAGALVGAFIGDALGLGPHWYYDLEELHRVYGPWINGYTTPQEGHYHEGHLAGELSQEGLIAKALLTQVAARGTYEEGDFTQWLDVTLLPKLNGEAYNGPGGYTSHSIRDLYWRRSIEGKPWTETGGSVDTTEAAQRIFVLAVRYAYDPAKVVETVVANTRLTQTDTTVLTITTAYASVLAALVRGDKLDETLSGKLLALVREGKLPFHMVNRPGSNGSDVDYRSQGLFPSPDALITPRDIARAARDPAIRIEPAWKVAGLYGLPCAIYHQIPSVYYLAARFPDDFESAVLHAINSGGQNLSRASLTGALVGAQVGLEQIPSRFIAGLDDHEQIVELARQVGAAVALEAEAVSLAAQTLDTRG